MARARTTTGGDRLLTMFRENVRRTRARGLSNIHIEDTTLKPGRITVRGRQVHNFGDCSYLGLGMEPRLQTAAKDAIDRYGTSYSSSIAYTAVPLYRDLKERMQQIMGAPVALAPTTTLAHASALPVLIRAGDVVLMDSAVHNSVQMATQLLTAAGVTVSPVPHGDVAQLERMIAEAGSGQGRTWYLADGVYSMSGATAPFESLTRLLDEHPDLWAYVDDAHGFSWHGLHGRGLAVDRMGWHDRLVIAGGLAKGFGSAGGFVATPDPELIELIEMCGPPLSFGGPITPATLGASVASADVHLSDELPLLQAAEASRITTTNRAALELGVPFVSFDLTPIFFVEIGRMDTMLEIVDAMIDDGFYLNGAMWPIVPHRRAGLRFTVTNSIDESTIVDLLELLRGQLQAHDLLERLEIDLREGDPVIRLGGNGE
jgi:7-keto-8-aminopelargonate synthetase-like enzyme